MNGRRALCCALAGVFMLAAAPACGGPNPGDYVVYRVEQSARVSALAAPDYDVDQSELDLHPGQVPFNIHLFVDPTTEPGEDDTSEPIVATFGWVSDGLCYQTYDDAGTHDDSVSNTCHTVEENTGEDVTFSYAVWTQLPQASLGEAVDQKLWYRQFPLDSQSVSALTSFDPGDFMFFAEEGYSSSNLSADDDSNLVMSTVDVDGLGEACSEIDLFVNNGLLVWDIDPDADSESFYIPLALLSTLTLTDKVLSTEPIVPPTGGTIRLNMPADEDRHDSFNGTSEETLTSGVRVFLVEPEVLCEGIEDAPIGPQVEPTIPAGGSVVLPFLIRVAHDFPAGPITDVSSPPVISNVPLPTPIFDTHSVPETPEEPLPRAYRGFPLLASESEDGPQTGTSPIRLKGFTTFGLVGSDSSGVVPAPAFVYNIPIDASLPFTPDEPHIVELPYTFWITIEPVDMQPGGAEDTDLVTPQTEPHELRVVIAPPSGGSVTVSTPAATEEPAFPPEGDANAVALDYLIEEETRETLSAVPSVGYRFVAWDSEDSHVEIQDPYSPTLTLDIKPALVYSKNPRKTTVVAHFAPATEHLPEDIFPEIMMGGTILPTSHTLEDKSGCEGEVYIDFEAVDLTWGQKPIADVRLDINGQEVWHWSAPNTSPFCRYGGKPTPRYLERDREEHSCPGEYTIEMQAANTEGQTLVITKETRVPPLTTHFEYDFGEPTGEPSARYRLRSTLRRPI